MNKAIAFAAVTTVAAALALPAFAQGTPRVDQRQANQDARRRHGACRAAAVVSPLPPAT